jgi:hypothetical protein
MVPATATCFNNEAISAIRALRAVKFSICRNEPCVSCMRLEIHEVREAFCSSSSSAPISIHDMHPCTCCADAAGKAIRRSASMLRLCHGH